MPLLVRGLERLGDLRAIGERLVERQRAALRSRSASVVALDELHAPAQAAAVGVLEAVDRARCADD